MTDFLALDRRAVERFWKKYDKLGPCPTHNPALGPCWLWTGLRFSLPQNYGRASCVLVPGTRLAHRIAFVLANGSIPDGKDVLHKCDNPPCGNPAHLYAGTDHDNVLDAFSRHRRSNRGESNPRAKLTIEQVVYIREHLATGSYQREMAELFGVSVSLIHEIKMGRCW
jgi:hypothetical protein